MNHVCGSDKISFFDVNDDIVLKKDLQFDISNINKNRIFYILEKDERPNDNYNNVTIEKIKNNIEDLFIDDEQYYVTSMDGTLSAKLDLMLRESNYKVRNIGKQKNIIGER